ncbi:MAG: hypothetical protein N3G21_03610 [Candidatus Hydrogenedentes bacterium]|nr:hypothetical protein [Candidatus Hydrogenedentota bacterium]
MANVTQELIIRKIFLYKYSLSFVKEVSIWGRQCVKREGLLIKLVDEEGKESWGEVAPIPFDKAIIESCVSEYLSLKKRLINPIYNEIVKNITSPYSRFGLYSAVKQNTWGMRSDIQSDFGIVINALLLGEEEEILIRLKELYERGFRVFKLKAGNNKIEEVIRLLSNIGEVYGENLRLILDLNKGLDLKSALYMLPQVANMEFIAYVEDPVNRVEDLKPLLEECGIKVGVDEFLVSDWVYVQSYCEKYGDRLVMIIKPSILFGNECWEKIIVNRHLEKVFSSSWETGVGTRAVLMMSHEINGGYIHTGIDTYSYFAEDICTPKLNTKRPKIPVREVMSPFKVDESKIELCGEVIF